MRIEPSSAAPAGPNTEADHPRRTRPRPASGTTRPARLGGVDWSGDWRPLTGGDEVVDDTRALTLDGRVVVSLAGAAPVRSPATAKPPACGSARIARGSYDSAPTLRGFVFNAVEVVQSVPAVTAAPIAAGTQSGRCPRPAPRAAFDLGLDAAGRSSDSRSQRSVRSAGRFASWRERRGSATVEAAAVGRGTGAPAQKIAIAGAPVVAGASRRVTNPAPGDEAGEWRAWVGASDFDASGRADAHSVLDPTRAPSPRRRRARADQRAASAIVLAADLTARAAGNLAAAQIDAVADSRRNRAAIPTSPMTGGTRRDRQPGPRHGWRAAEIARHDDRTGRDEHEPAARAVTLHDHVALAMATPGVGSPARKRAANFHPGFPCVTAPGVVTVLVLPFLPADRPVPSAGLRHAVAAYLDAAASSARRVEVAGTRYVTVSSPRVRASRRRRARPTCTRRSSRRSTPSSTRCTADPTAPAGRSAGDVYRSEVLQVIDDMPGVAHVLALDLAEDRRPDMRQPLHRPDRPRRRRHLRDRRAMNPMTAPRCPFPERLRHAQRSAAPPRLRHPGARSTIRIALVAQPRGAQHLRHRRGPRPRIPSTAPLLVLPGLAYDSFGRELMLDAAWQARSGRRRTVGPS